MVDDEPPDGPPAHQHGTEFERERHEQALRSLAVANLRAFTTRDDPRNELNVLAFEVDALVDHLNGNPSELPAFLEATATLLGSLYVQLAEASGLTRADALHLARKPL